MGVFFLSNCLSSVEVKKVRELKKLVIKKLPTQCWKNGSKRGSKGDI
jgi:hypothetical protein